ncbi:hypothetical protein G7Y89_g2037 [Cudoniella acicularis]|uniref:F-box domain-containing protein n=1 Tax=Cudoniella acicularis TaxID=354080 RepID=A0A8H4RU49_9HELO|nr:hypothetical protein G7Y89_g2037 [Cudoniella acicularis]
MPPLGFLDFPGEIRNQIYRELLIVPAVSTPRLLGDPPIYPQVLSVCRKVHKEAQQMLYCCNTFLAHPNLLTALPRLRLYYDTIYQPHLISLIRRYHIRVRLDCDPNFSALKAKEAFTRLDELTVEVFQAQFGSSDYKVLKLFEGVRGVQRARVYGSVTEFPEYIEWLQKCMTTPEGLEVDVFDKDKARENHVRSYDIWTVTWGAVTEDFREDISLVNLIDRTTAKKYVSGRGNASAQLQFQKPDLEFSLLRWSFNVFIEPQGPCGDVSQGLINFTSAPFQAQVRSSPVSLSIFILPDTVKYNLLYYDLASFPRPLRYMRSLTSLEFHAGDPRITPRYSGFYEEKQYFDPYLPGIALQEIAAIIMTVESMRNFIPWRKQFFEAKEAAISYDIELFKAHRADAVEYVEWQYQRIVLVSDNLVEFIKASKRKGAHSTSTRGLLILGLD